MIHTTSQPGDYPTDFSNGQIRAVADAPLEKGGMGAGFGPHELLEAALATCINMAVRMSANKLGIVLEGAATSVRLDRSQPDVVKYEYTLELVGSLTDKERQQLEEAANACPVRQTLSKRANFIAAFR
ncbi:MAG: OsmC family protein [Steroidobacteraceae bacterium]